MTAICSLIILASRCQRRNILRVRQDGRLGRLYFATQGLLLAGITGDDPQKVLPIGCCRK